MDRNDTLWILDRVKSLVLADLPSFALKDDLSGFVRTEDLPAAPDLSEYATLGDLPDLAPYLRIEDLPAPPDLTPYALGSSLAQHEGSTLGVHGIADTSRLITQDNIGAYAPPPDLSGYARLDASQTWTASQEFPTITFTGGTATLGKGNTASEVRATGEFVATLGARAGNDVTARSSSPTMQVKAGGIGPASEGGLAIGNPADRKWYRDSVGSTFDHQIAATWIKANAGVAAPQFQDGASTTFMKPWADATTGWRISNIYPAAVPLAVRIAAGQSVNAFQIEDPLGVVNARISQAGAGVFNTLNAGGSGSGQLFSQSSVSNRPAAGIRAASGATVTTLSVEDAGGQAGFNVNPTETVGPRAQVTLQRAAQQGLVVKMAATPTAAAEPFQIQDSTGLARLSTDVAGSLYAGRVNATPAGGGLKMGDVGWGALGYFGLAHADRFNTNDFALLQGVDGTTILNAPTGKPIEFRRNNGSAFARFPANDLELTVAGAGIKLKSPNGAITKTLTIDNSGFLVVT